MYAGREGRDGGFTVIYYNADGETRKRDQTGCQFCVFLLARWGKEGRRVLRLTHIFSS